jgi:hypothetical protein
MKVYSSVYCRGSEFSKCFLPFSVHVIFWVVEVNPVRYLSNQSALSRYTFCYSSFYIDYAEECFNSNLLALT